jgi:hypothetical protein
MDKVGNALEISMHNATEEFGFAPRDIYNGFLGRRTETPLCWRTSVIPSCEALSEHSV